MPTTAEKRKRAKEKRLERAIASIAKVEREKAERKAKREAYLLTPEGKQQKEDEKALSYRTKAIWITLILAGLLTLGMFLTGARPDLHIVEKFIGNIFSVGFSVFLYLVLRRFFWRFTAKGKLRREREAKAKEREKKAKEREREIEREIKESKRRKKDAAGRKKREQEEAEERAAWRALYIALTDISGVNDQLARTLMDQFPTSKSIKWASTEDLQEIPGVGPKVAKAIKVRSNSWS